MAGPSVFRRKTTTDADSLKTAEMAVLPSQASPRPSKSGFERMIIGPNARPGRRLLIFVVLLVVLLGGFALISHGGLQNVLDAQKYAAEITVTTLWMALTEAIAFVVFGFLL